MALVAVEVSVVIVMIVVITAVKVDVTAKTWNVILTTAQFVSAAVDSKEVRMEVIVSRLAETFRIMGKQEFWREVSYRRIPYCIEQDISGGKLVFNTLTGEMLFLPPTEASLFVERPGNLECGKVIRYLVEHWYYLPEQMDAHSVGYMVRLGGRGQRRDSRVDSFTVLTTTICNAMCPYCYERGVRQHSMDRQIAEDTAEYIKNAGTGEIALRWFGGEPLCNTLAMDIITERLREAGIPFRSSITTNGYLFCKIPDSTVEGWNLQNAQITIDGTRDRYNEIKNYAETGSDPYEVVMENIEHLLEMGISIAIRMNVSNENAEDLLQLVDELSMRFQGKRRIAAYPYPVFEGTGDPPFCPTDKERERLYNNCIRIFDRTVKNGLAPRRGLRFGRPYHCMADSRKSRVVLPDGKVSLCQHYNESEVCGSIYTNKMDREKVSEWSKRTVETSECRECAMYPICIRLEKCPNEVQCSIGERKFNERKIRSAMLWEYGKMKR